MSEEFRRNYNYTSDYVQDTLSDCENRKDLKECHKFGCEFLGICEGIERELKLWT